jgi:hypothetical protein
VKKNIRTGKEVPITEEDVHLLIRQEMKRKRLKRSLEALMKHAQ